MWVLSVVMIFYWGLLGDLFRPDIDEEKSVDDLLDMWSKLIVDM